MKVTAKKKGLREIAEVHRLVQQQRFQLGASASTADTAAPQDAQKWCSKVSDLDVSTNLIESLLMPFDNASDAGGPDSTNESARSSSALGPFRSLVRLDLHKNALGRTRLHGIAGVSNTLTWLNLADNKLESLEGLEQCSSLQYLDVSRNQLTRLAYLPAVAQQGAAPYFILKATGNMLRSGTALLQDVADRIGHALMEVDVSFNKIDTAPLPLLLRFSAGASDTVLSFLQRSRDDDLAQESDITRMFDAVRNVQRLNLDCNPCLVNGSLERTLLFLIRGVMKAAALTGDGGVELCAAELRSMISQDVKGGGGCDGLLRLWKRSRAFGLDSLPEVSIKGRNDAEESQWRRRAVAAVDHEHRRLIRIGDQPPPGTSALESSRASSLSTSALSDRCREMNSEWQQPAGGDDTTANERVTTDFAAAGGSRVTSYAQDVVNLPTPSSNNYNNPPPVVGLPPAPATAAVVANVFSRTSSRSSSFSVISSSALSSNAAPAGARDDDVDGSVSWIGCGPYDTHQIRSLYRENKTLRKEVESMKRMLREQLGSIRTLQDSHAAALAHGADMEAKLKRKTVECAALLRRAHDAEDAASALQEQLVQLKNAGTEEDTHASSSSRSALLAAHRGDTSLPLHERRTFHLSDAEHSQLSEKHHHANVSHSFDKKGSLISGRFAHAHRSFVYAEDLEAPQRERQEFARLAAKHQMEHEKPAKPRRGAVQVHRYFQDPYPAKSPSDEVVHSNLDDDPLDGESLKHERGTVGRTREERDEVVLFLSERVAHLETMLREHEAYCEDLARENDELLAKYEKLAASTLSEVVHH